MRSIIVGTETGPDGDGGYGMRVGLNRQELRTLLLFADQVDHPIVDEVPIESTVEEQFLESVGFLIRTSVKSRSKDRHDFLIGPHLRLLEEKLINEPGKWAISSDFLVDRNLAISFKPDDFGGLPGYRIRMSPSLRISLQKAIPVPDQDVPYEAILEFKAKRNSELLTFRHHLDSVYQAIFAAPDRPLAEVTELEKLEISIQNTLQVLRESKFSLTGLSLTGTFSISAAAAAFYASLPMGLVAASGFGLAAGASIEIVKSTAIQVSGANSSDPYQYVLSYHRDVFGPQA